MVFQRHKVSEEDQPFRPSGSTRSKRTLSQPESEPEAEETPNVKPYGIRARLRKKLKLRKSPSPEREPGNMEIDFYDHPMRSSEPPPEIDVEDRQDPDEDMLDTPRGSPIPQSPNAVRSSSAPPTPHRPSRYNEPEESQNDFDRSLLLEQHTSSNVAITPQTPLRHRTSFWSFKTPSHDPSPRGAMKRSPFLFERDGHLGERARKRAVEKARAAIKAGDEAIERMSQAQKKIEGEVDRAHDIFSRLSKPISSGGYGFNSPWHFFERLFQSGSEKQGKINVTRFCKDHGAELAEKLFERLKESFTEFRGGYLADQVRKEAAAIQKLLTRPSGTKMSALIDSFNLEKLEEEIEAVAPTLWSILQSYVLDGKKEREKPEEGTGKGKGKERQEEERINEKSEKEKDRDAILATICAMLSITRSQKANDFQVVMGLFLLASGASKREVDVLSHAGLSVSYSSVLRHVKALSRENLAEVQRVVKEFLVAIIWDNVNFAFRVGSERIDSKDHFDNGTTATVVVQHNPFTNWPAEQGSLPIPLKPPRSTTYQSISDHSSLILPNLDHLLQLEQCLLWQLKRLAIDNTQGLARFENILGSCPSFGEYDQISVHVTQQYPLPAMHLDESTIDGTMQVYDTVLEHMNMSSSDLEQHGLLFVDGDLLTDSLIDKVCYFLFGGTNHAELSTYKVESARRNCEGVREGMKAVIRRFGLFHCKMAGCRMVLNEHWGEPNSKWPGSLWWEHTQLLKRKAISAGWQTKKAAPWKPTHELIQMSLAAHVLDGFRIYCGHVNFQLWATKSTFDEFNRVAKLVYENLFTSAAHAEQAHATGGKDIVLMNNILYNRDALLYWLLVTSIKTGNIGRVVLVLRVWMVMMRTPKTMPCYANAIFETLGRIQEYPEKLRVFFLHNWLVNLTGRTNGFKENDLLEEQQNRWVKHIRPLHFLSHHRIVAKAFRTPYNSTQHTTPDMLKEIHCIADALCDERVQEYVPDRPANESVAAVRDLFKEGSKQANKKSAFRRYRADTTTMENLGVTEEERPDIESEDEDEDSDSEPEYVATDEDVALDNDEPELTEALINAAVTIVNDIFD
ncbi:hypothetical protein V5O48_012934 [Marasmius crinis-equi]|uniref:DUF6589 domain-containing protein n=1 Tax=Marasmius crinis-equi TaxID=585013 RepID=A0ABR3F1F5_9AGAR